MVNSIDELVFHVMQESIYKKERRKSVIPNLQTKSSVC